MHISSIFICRTLAVTILLAGTFLSSAAQSETLNQAIETAISKNPQMGAANATRKAVDKQLRQARGLYLPQVDVVSGAGPEWTSDTTTRALGTDKDNLFRTDARLQVTQRVFNAFQTTHEVNRQKARVSGAAYRVRDNAQIVAIDTIAAYLDVLRQHELAELSKKNIEFHHKVLENLSGRAESGVGTKADVAQANARLARAEAIMTQIQNDLANAEAFYIRVTGLQPFGLEKPVTAETLFPQNLDAVMQLASSSTPIVQAANADVNASKEEIGLARAGYYPTVNIEADAGYNDNSGGRETYGKDARVMLRGRWNLYRGGIDRAAHQESIYRLQASNEQRNRIVNEIVEESQRAWFAYQASAERLDQLKRAIDDLQETRLAYQEQFAAGQRSLLDLLDTENELFTTRSQLVTAEMTRMISGYRVLAASGTLLQNLNIQAPETANPEPEKFSF